MPSIAPIKELSTEQAIRYGRRLRLQGRPADAEAVFRAVVRRDPAAGDAWLGLGQSLLDRLQAVDAIGPIERAARTRSSSGEVHHALAVAYGITGDQERSRRHFDKALEWSPHDPDVIRDYARSRRFTARDRFAEKIEGLLKSPGLKKRQKLGLHFVAGKVWDDVQRYDRAWHHFQVANAHVECRFAANRWRKLVDDSVRFFDSPTTRRLRSQATPTRPIIFVVGCPRSGTTLVEQILATHPDVVSVGEKSALSETAARTVLQKGSMLQKGSRSRFPRCLDLLTDRQVATLAHGYLDQVSSTTGRDARVLCDKTPSNFYYLGLINALFANARLVHCRRHPLDTLLSCYFTHFRGGQEYSYDLGDLAEYYAGYQKLTRHWSQVSLIDIEEIAYENLVSDQRSVTQRLLRETDLPWHEDCLSFHRTVRPVATASSWQVRQPLYQRSVNRWKHYAPYLGPLIEALERLDVRWDETMRIDEAHADPSAAHAAIKGQAIKGVRPL